MAKFYSILENVNGEFVLYSHPSPDEPGTHKTLPLQLGKPFPDEPAAIKGMKRVISDSRTYYDEKGKKIENPNP